ncbi:hypothetical protein KSP35_21985 [Aquihabitans sp. G128]|uniref:tetratricopeptide repeat protein n=1 Tax=Aquihabitans sp. G128 TaxID=2849779 RepID=UPI001C250EB6|nr:hypothetical protein [Aquihabitans sp. G128]QXC60952.1 hypothetical protein KSP35_21985 [Aquihabitans sp. G128]
MTTTAGGGPRRGPEPTGRTGGPSTRPKGTRAATGSGSKGPARLDPDELAALEEQRDFLLRSLQDLEREHDAGDLEDDDYRELRDDYTGRAAETLRAIDEQRAAFADARTGKGRGRTLATFGAVILFAVVAGLLVASSLGARKAGDTITGGVDTQQTPSQKAQACVQQMDPQAPSKPIACFRAVLDDDPKNVVALTWLSWQLELSADYVPAAQAAELQDAAGSMVERAVTSDPGYSYARAFRAIIAFRHGQYAEAKRYLADFRARKPSSEAEALITQFDLDGQIDTALAGGGTTTTVPGATTSVPLGPVTTTTTPG